MAGFIGRKLLIKKNSVIVAGIQTRSLNINGEPVESTNDDDVGFRTYLDDVGTKSFDLSVDMIAGDDLWQEIMLSGSTTTYKLSDIIMEWPLRTGEITPATLACDLVLSNYSLNASTAETATQTVSLGSSGAWTYTAGA